MHTPSLLFSQPTFSTVMALIPAKREMGLGDNFFLGIFYMKFPEFSMLLVGSSGNFSLV